MSSCYAFQFYSTLDLKLVWFYVVDSELTKVTFPA